jgi:hypothetical protein
MLVGEKFVYTTSSFGSVGSLESENLEKLVSGPFLKGIEILHD